MQRTCLRSVIVVIALFCASPASAALDGLRARLEDGAGDIALRHVSGGELSGAALRDFYAARGFHPLWVEQDAPSARAAALVA